MDHDVIPPLPLGIQLNWGAVGKTRDVREIPVLPPPPLYLPSESGRRNVDMRVCVCVRACVCDKFLTPRQHRHSSELLTGTPPQSQSAP